MKITSRHDDRQHDLIGLVNRTPAGPAVLVIAALLMAVFLIDRATGATPFQHLYYAGIVLAGIRFRLRGALLAAFTADGLYHVANPRLLTLRYAEADLVQVVLFFAVGVVAARVSIDTRRLRHLAMTDDLTGLHNLRSFERHLVTMLRADAAPAMPLALFVVDIDRLKSLNDRHGHLVGADAVRTVGHVIGAWAGDEAVACRYGGDEFVVAWPRCARAAALVRADALRQAVDELAPTLDGRDFPRGVLSVSIGLACREAADAPTRLTPADARGVGERLFRAADTALYRAKAGGRNATYAAWSSADRAGEASLWLR